MKVIILGAGGQLAYDLRLALGQRNLIPFQHEDLDICHHQEVRKTLQKFDPQIVINTAAYVKVDECENRVEKAFQVNAFAVRNLAQVCGELGCTLVHFSTDYVFDGMLEIPYTESDLPNPLNVYGASKLAGEYFVRNSIERYFIIRTAGLYGSGGAGSKGGNFVKTMLDLADKDQPVQVVDDQILTPTYTRDLAQAVVKLLPTKKYGLYHITNQGQCSWYEFAGTIFDRTGLDPELSIISSQELGGEARRPGYSVLDNTKVMAVLGEGLPPWEEALTDYFEERKETSR